MNPGGIFGVFDPSYNWSERSACASGANIGRPLFYIINLFFCCFVGGNIDKTPEGVVVGFQMFAWAPN